jgi:hypothetical protein
MHAITGMRLNIAAYLLDCGANVNIKDIVRKASYACGSNVDFLLQAGHMTES